MRCARILLLCMAAPVRARRARTDWRSLSGGHVHHNDLAAERRRPQSSTNAWALDSVKSLAKLQMLAKPSSSYMPAGTAMHRRGIRLQVPGISLAMADSTAVEEKSKELAKAAEELKSRFSVVKTLDDFFAQYVDVNSSLEWSKELNGALAPVEPVENVKLDVKSGSVPSDLSGAFMRVGPNAFYWPPSKRVAPFDGDGMVHSVRIVNGEATYHCKYLETPRLQFERHYGQEWFNRIGELESKLGLPKQLIAATKVKAAGLDKLYEGGGLANTAIVSTPDGKLWALHELAPPFRFRLDANGVPRSIGYDTFDGTHERMVSAHPKFDRETNEMFFHGREMLKTFFVARAEGGEVTNSVELNQDNLEPIGFHHDLIVTKNYIVVIDGSVKFNKKALVKGLPSRLFALDTNSTLRFGVLERTKAKTMRPEDFTWIETPSAAEIVHVLHAYDEDGKIILWAPMGFPTHETASEENDGASGKEGGGILEGMTASVMRRTVIDLHQRSVEIENIPGGDCSTEFPRVRDDSIGRKIRYGFSAPQAAGVDFNFRGIQKWDFDKACLSKTLWFPEGVVGGEPVFIPKDGAPDAEGDNGYIGLFLWHSRTAESTFAVYDAKSLSDTPVVEFAVPRRVPLGFHGAWISEEQFQQQLERA